MGARPLAQNLCVQKRCWQDVWQWLALVKQLIWLCTCDKDTCLLQYYKEIFAGIERGNSLASLKYSLQPPN